MVFQSIRKKGEEGFGSIKESSGEDVFDRDGRWVFFEWKKSNIMAFCFSDFKKKISDKLD